MKKIHLQHVGKQGLVEATFSPSHGMNLLSFKIGGNEIIDQTTKEDFHKRYGGLGPLIGPHFYHRTCKNLPVINESVLPHIKNLTKSQLEDPISHGIGRYCSWNYFETSSSIKANISGMDTIKDQTLASIEGFDFSLDYSCFVTKTGLDISYQVESKEIPSTIGLHYYLAISDGPSYVSMDCKKKYNDMGTWKDIPKKWLQHDKVHLTLDQHCDFGFLPNSKDNSGSCILVTPLYSLKVSYQANSEENAFQIYHQKDSSFVCIEPVSAKNPRDPKGLSHKMEIKFELL